MRTQQHEHEPAPCHDSPAGPRPGYGDLILRSPPNWTAVVFLALLGGLHLGISVSNLLHGRREAYLSLAFGTAFLLLAAFFWCCRFEVAVLCSQRRLRLRHGSRRAYVQRSVPFAQVQGVRLTVPAGARPADCCLQIVCPLEDLDVPPTRIPRQEALFLALAMGVPLVKVLEEVNAGRPAGSAIPEPRDSQAPSPRG